MSRLWCSGPGRRVDRVGKIGSVIRIGWSVLARLTGQARGLNEQAGVRMVSKQWSEIQELAYKIWLEEGCPHGRDLDHWLRAESEVILLNLYRSFQQVRRPLNHLYPMIGYDDSFLGDRYNPFSLLAVLMAQSHPTSIAHNINRFGNELRSLTAWAKVFETATEGGRISALYEFAYPIASQCLSMPYSIKQAFIKSVCQISHQTNRFLDGNWTEKALPEKPNFPDAKRLAGRFPAWTALSAALAPLDDEAFRVASDDYRNQANHGLPRRIGYGYTPVIRRDRSGQNVARRASRT
jgi:hypothetical protein